MPSRYSRQSLVAALTIYASQSWAQSSTVTAPGQPASTQAVNTFKIVGDSLVSAQQIFLGTTKKVYVVDKAENNPAQVAGHPAWASEYDTSSNKARTMDIVTNSFCAGGNVLGNGTWVNVGGNQAVTYGGVQAESQTGGGPFDDPDGRDSIRLLNPCDDGNCEWFLGPKMTSKRWYPTLETLGDGSIFILGGCENGGYVNDAKQDNPTYEFFPSKGDPIKSPIVANTLPANLYPLTWLLPSGELFIQSNLASAKLNLDTNTETYLDAMPDACRVYPSSAGTAMLPLTPANNWTATIIFCGGNDIKPEEWTTLKNIPTIPTVTSCVTITPDVNGSYSHVDSLPEGRNMVNFVLLPTGKIFAVNGGHTGTAGYGNESWAIGQSYGDNPIYKPIVYDYLAPAGSQWSDNGLGTSTVPRMYHSVAILLPDGSIFISGSNPNVDYVTGVTYSTEYRVEFYYPSYYNERRPEPKGLPSSLSYGGPAFNITLDKDDLFGSIDNIKNATVVLIRPGFSTHTMNMGQRFVQLDCAYFGDGSTITGTLMCNQLPPNANIIAPGPALLFVVVNGVPSVGIQVMLGNGKIGTQPLGAAVNLPGSSITNLGNSNNGSNGSSGGKSGAARLGARTFTAIIIAGALGGILL